MELAAQLDKLIIDTCLTPQTKLRPLKFSEVVEYLNKYEQELKNG